MEVTMEVNKRKIVFTHQNIDINVESRHIVSNANEVNDIIARHGVSHVYQGHYHYGAENIINGIPYTTLRAMCIGEETNYLIADITGTGIPIEMIPDDIKEKVNKDRSNFNVSNF